MHFIHRLSLLILLVSALAGSIHESATASTGPASCMTATEWRLLDQLNVYRGLHGLDQFVTSPTLTAAARHQAESMARYGYFPSDYSVQFEGPKHDQTITWQENIANAGYPDNTHTKRAAMIGSGSESVEAIVQTLTSLPAYQDVLNDPRYLAIGIGFAADPSNPDEAYWTVTLGSLVDARLATCQDVSLPLEIAGATASADTSDPMLATDGDLSTTWLTTSEQTDEVAWITVDLGSVQTISRIEWMFTEPGLADAFTIEVAIDPTQSSVIASKTNGVVDQWRSLSWSGSARYIRFAFANTSGAVGMPCLAEIRVFG
jgi:uncharacterized protein YkwD